MDSYNSVGGAAPGSVRDSPPTPPVAGRRETAQRWPDPRAAAKLWSRLVDLREGGQPRVVADVEEALFRFYTPLAHMLAENDGAAQHDGRARMLAEIGLAKAILVWPLPDEAWFEEYARNAIHAEFVNHSVRDQLTNPLVRRMRVMSARVAETLRGRRVRPGG